MMVTMGSQQIIVFDVETTGTDVRRDQVIELCVQFGLDHDAPHRVWRIRPDVPIHPEAQAVHGISADDLRDCPRFADVADTIRAVFAPAEVLVGYNLSFDIGMLQAEYARLDQFIDLRAKQVVDPFRLWQQCEPRSLMHAHKRFVGDSFAEAHSAAADVAATGRVLRGMLKSFELGDRSWEDIAAVCEPESDTWVGSSRHLRWSDEGRPVLGFGKHKGKALDALASSEDEGYLRWILGNDFPSHVHQICVRALELPAEQFLAWVRELHGPPPASDQEVAVEPSASAEREQPAVSSPEQPAPRPAAGATLPLAQHRAATAPSPPQRTAAEPPAPRPPREAASRPEEATTLARRAAAALIATGSAGGNADPQRPHARSEPSGEGRHDDRPRADARPTSAQLRLANAAATPTGAKPQVAKRPATSKSKSAKKPVKAATLLLPLEEHWLAAPDRS